MIARYSRPEMAAIWSDEAKLAFWLRVELAALEGWAEAGAVPADAVARIRERAVPPTPERVAEIEEDRTRCHVRPARRRAGLVSSFISSPIGAVQIASVSRARRTTMSR